MPFIVIYLETILFESMRPFSAANLETFLINDGHTPYAVSFQMVHPGECSFHA